MYDPDAPFDPEGEGGHSAVVDAVGTTGWLVTAVSLSVLLIGFAGAALIIN
jgi:hypothetical protein